MKECIPGDNWHCLLLYLQFSRYKIKYRYIFYISDSKKSVVVLSNIKIYGNFTRNFSVPQFFFFADKKCCWALTFSNVWWGYLSGDSSCWKFNICSMPGVVFFYFHPIWPLNFRYFIKIIRSLNQDLKNDDDLILFFRNRRCSHE